jgi:hypothetical protein
LGGYIVQNFLLPSEDSGHARRADGIVLSPRGGHTLQIIANRKHRFW